MKRTHKTIVDWCYWSNCYRAHSDTLGEDVSPYGEGPTEPEALLDLARQLEELKDKKHDQAC